MTRQQAILVVEDEPNFGRILEAKLRRSSFDVEVAGDAASALANLLRRRYDLVVAEAQMRGVDMVALLPQLRGAAPETPFLLMSSYPSEDYRARATQAGAADLLLKPFDLDFFVQSVRMYVRGDMPHIVAPLHPPAAGLSPGGPITVQPLVPADAPAVAARVLSRRADTFVVALDTSEEFRLGDTLRVEYTNDDALYRFRSTVVETRPGNRRMVLTRPNVIYRKQRRRTPRVLLRVPVHIRPIAFRAGPAEGTVINAMGQDIGVGGIGLACNAPLEPGTPLELDWLVSMPNEPGTRMTARGRVANSRAVPGGPHLTVYRVGIRFTHLEDNVRETLVALTNPPQI